MATNETNGISLRRLKTFLTNLKNIFAEKNHSHATSDITGLDNALSSKATAVQGLKADTAVQSVKIGNTEYKSGTTVTLPPYPTTLPASDVSSWAKQQTKPSYTASEIGAAPTNHTHTTVNGHTVESDVPSGAKFTDTNTWRPQPDWNATSGDAVIKNKPTSMPASDVYSWAKQKTKPTYTASEIGLGSVGNFKAVSTVASQGLSDAEKANARANIGAGTSSFSGSYNDLNNKPAIPSVGNGTITITQNGTTKGTFTTNQSGNTTIALTDTDTNTTYGVATSSTLGLVKSGTDITVDSSGNVSVNDDSHNHVISNVDGLQSALDGKLSKTTYEYNKELALGSSCKVCIGVFPCYDSNISVEIKSTTSTTYNGTLIIATQNINTSLGGVYSATVYGDENNTLTSAIKIQYLSGSNAFSVYINLSPWSKNILHIQCVSLAGTPSSIATIVDSIPTTANIVPKNAFTHTHSYAGSSSVGGSATSAVKLDSSAGSATQPVYFSGGKPVACSYTLGKSVPSNAVFTDTNTWRPLGTTADTACAGNDSRLSNARPASDVYAWAKASSKPSYTYSEVGAAAANHSHSNYLTGINKTMVVNALGYTPPTTNTTYNVATQSSNGLFSASDKKKLDGITSGSNTIMKLISSTDYSRLTDAQKKNGTVYFVV